MRQLLCDMMSGRPRLEELPTPGVGPRQILVRTRCSLVSVGTELAGLKYAQSGVVEKARRSPEQVRQVIDHIRSQGLLQTVKQLQSRLGELKPLGYCNVGSVIEIGPEVTGFRVGDRVVSNAPHCEVAAVSPTLCAHVPDDVPDEAAVFTVLASVGLHGIRLIAPELGETVVVIGLGVIGLLTAQLLKAHGCRVIGFDTNASRVALSSNLGVEAFNTDSSAPVEVASRVTGGNGADAVIITASAEGDQIIADAARMARKRGRIVLVGVTGLNLDRSLFYTKELSFQVSCSYGPGRYDTTYEQEARDYPIGYVRWTVRRNFDAVLRAIRSGQLAVLPLIERHVPFDRAESVYADLMSTGGALGVVFDYPAEAADSRGVRTGPGAAHEATAGCSAVAAGVVGAGSYAKSTFLPALKKTGVEIIHVTDLNAVNALHAARIFGAADAVNDYHQILEDPAVGAVFVLVRHDLHARLVRESLAAGKHVFVEKPLALNAEELKAVTDAHRQAGDRLLMVGFNRRFSPHVVRCRELLRDRREPLAMNVTVNAGSVPPDSWVHDPVVGGGRIVGEACHFVDLMVHLARAPVSTVAATMQGVQAFLREDQVSISLAFGDGSVGTVNYFGNGPRSYPKECIELFCEGRVLRIDDFRVTTGYGWRGFRQYRSPRQDKGHENECQAFVGRCRSGGEPLIRLDEMVNVTLACFAGVLSARECRTIHLEKEFPEFYCGGGNG